MLQPTTVSYSPHLEALDLKLFTDGMNLRLTQQLLSGQRLGLEQPEMPIKLIEPSKRVQGL